MISIIDYGCGNLRSVINAFVFLNANINVVSDPCQLKSSDKIVLPGVGSFQGGINRLATWLSSLNDKIIGEGIPFLGICLGMQLLCNFSEEGGLHYGFKWIDSTVIRLTSGLLRLPHIGWNDVFIENDSVLYKNLRNPTFYFAHSYHMVPQDISVVKGRFEYGGIFVASVEYKNIFGVQFHPEKSHSDGLTVLQNFINL